MTLACGEKNHPGRVVPTGSKRLHEVPAIEPGHHDVADDQREASLAGQSQPLLAVVRDFYGEPALLKALPQVGRGLRLILDDEQAHRE